ncbi:MAG: hypothetical protein M1820_005805 [Bogoriella megaspora]|nr:MAG: hypothetical protein M1820_005805 [Bogoriella megaspora]
MSAYEKQSPPDPYSSENSDSKRRQSASSGSKRASRAGTRSVSTLTAAQLERKRANDREAQRAIRQRTKDHIEHLERRIEELTSNQGLSEKLIQRNKELEHENALLRSRLGTAAVALGVEGQEQHGQAAPVIEAGSLNLSVPSPQPSAFQSMGQQQRSSGTGTPQRQTSGTPTPSSINQSDPWQQQSASFNPSNPSSVSRSSRTDIGQQSNLWRTESNESDRSPPVMQPTLSSGVNYGYMMDSTGRPLPYRGDQSIPSYAASGLATDYQQRLPSQPQDYKAGQSMSSAQGYQARSNQTSQDYAASTNRSSSHLADYQGGNPPTDYSRATGGPGGDYQARGAMPGTNYQARDMNAQSQAMSGAVGAYCPMPNTGPYMATASAAPSPSTTYAMQQNIGAMHPHQQSPLRYYDPHVG